MRGLKALAKVELLLFLRNPSGVFMALLLPSLLLLLQGFVIPGGQDVVESGAGGLRAIDFLMPVSIAVAVTSVAVTNYPASIGAHREAGVLRRLDTTPVGARRVLLAQWVASGASLAAAILVCGLLSWIVLDAVPPRNGVLLAAAILAGAVSMMALGSVIAAIAPSAQAAYGLGLLVFIASLFTAGIWTPGPLMPEGVRVISAMTPIGAMTQAMAGAWFDGGTSIAPFLVMAAWAAATGLLAVKLFRWR